MSEPATAEAAAGAAYPGLSDLDPPSLLRELRSHPPAARAGRIARDPRFARRALVDLLIADARERLFDRPGEAVELTRLAVTAAEHLDPEATGAERAHDCAARAWAQHANALRVDGDPAGAEQAFDRAHEHRRKGGGDPLLEARIHELEASFHKEQERFERAYELLATAIAVYRRQGADDRLARALVKQGSFLALEGRFAGVLRSTLEALKLLRPERDPRTFTVAAHNTIYALSRSGYSIAARSMLDAVRGVHERLGDRINLLRLDWITAEIDRELGLAARAEQGLLAVREGFIERGMPYEAALASLQLAEIYAHDGDSLRLERLAREMLPIFQSRSLHRGALAALILFREAIAMRQADLRLIGDLIRFFRQARRDRRMKFVPH